MKRFPWLEERGAAVAFMSGEADGDCGWDGCASGTRRAFLEGAPIPADKLVVLRQCHGDVIWTVETDDAGKGAYTRATTLGVGDGLITRLAGIPMGSNVADCVPVFLVGGGATAIVHAGRVGTELGIAARAVESILRDYGIHPSALFALIGPSAGPCCYKVGSDVLAASVDKGVAAVGDHLDLWETNRRQLRNAGLLDAHIAVEGTCTICQPGFFSYRARGTGERNLAIIMG